MIPVCCNTGFTDKPAFQHYSFYLAYKFSKPILFTGIIFGCHSAVKVRSGNLGPIGNVAKQTGTHQESNPGHWCTRQQGNLRATPICIAVMKSAAIIFQLKCLLTLIYLYAVALHPMAHVQDKTAMPTTKHTVPVRYSKHITGKFWLW